MEKKILFLDFDGVLFDTIKEAYLINRFLYNGTGFFDVLDKKNFELFSKYKYLVYNIWMFYYYNQIIFKCENENVVEESFKNLLLRRDIKKEDAFCREFLNARCELIKNHKVFWQNLEEPYKFFFEIKKIYEDNKINLVIASKKNKNSIVEKLYSYKFFLPKEYIFAREALDKYNSKGKFLEEYMLQNSYTKAIFVDDNFNNLNTVKSKNIKIILASWGNTAPNHKGLSEQEAINEIKNFFFKTSK